MKYSLVTLLKVREYNKTNAELRLVEARHQLESEEKKLCQMKNHLLKTINGRAMLQDNFFVRAQQHPMNKREALMLASLLQKNLSSQTAIKKSLSMQEQIVQSAEQRKRIATSCAIEAQRDLKIIDKHHTLWQHQRRKHENLKAEYENDDQNGVRYWSRFKRV